MSDKAKKIDYFELAIAIFFLVLSGLLFNEISGLPASIGYSGIGPRMVPGAVGFGVLAVGLCLLYQAVTGGFRGLEHEGQGVTPNARAVGWIVGGLVVFMLTAKPIGFIFAATVLFMSAAKGFGSTRWKLDLGAGLGVSVSAFVFFNKVLGVDLPYGILKFLV